MYRNIIKQIFLMKYKINSMSLLVLFLMGVISFSFMACSDSNSSGGQPEITGVKILSSDTLNYSYDEYYTKAGPGTMIAIEGKNLGGALKVFINNQELTFNTTMNTDHSIIVSIPTEEKGFKLSAFEDVPDEIRVETRGGVATYEFKVTAPGPQLQRIQAEYPRETGDEIILHGLNLVDIEDAYFSDVTVEELAESESKEIGGNHVAISNIETVLMDHHLASNNSYVTTSILKFAMPEVPYQSGVIVLECAAGTTYIAYYKVPGQPTITSISSDMPQIGEDLIIEGTEFVQVESVKYGDVTLTEDEFEVNEEQTQITIPFAKKPSAGSEAKLTVTTPGGTVSVDRFYDYSTILTTFNKDDAGNFIDATNNGWGPDAQFIDGGDADGVYAYWNIPSEGTQWWGTMVYFRKDWSGNSFPLSDNIPDTATADEVYFAINVYNDGSDYNNGAFTGYVRYMFQPIGDKENQYDNGFAWADYDNQIPSFARPVLADINNEAPVGRWYRHVLPLSSFDCYWGKTYAEIKATGLNQFRIQSLNQGTPSGKINVKFDNARVIYIPSK